MRSTVPHAVPEATYRELPPDVARQCVPFRHRFGPPVAPSRPNAWPWSPSWRALPAAQVRDLIRRVRLGGAWTAIGARCRAGLLRQLAATIRPWLQQAEAPPVELRRLSPKIDRGPPARDLAFTGQINEAIP